jgi:pimeloyl-ACP methyl ester carboxylesterase
MSTENRYRRLPRARAWLAALVALAGLSGLLTGIASADSSTLLGNSDSDKPTVVLVHGAWADASGWTGTIRQLRRQGFPVIAPANPLRGLTGDSAYIASVLADIEGPIILVGHSYGGAVITNAAVGNDNVKALVYIAGFAPATGEPVFGVLGMFPGSQVEPALHVIPFPLPDGEVGLDAYIVQDMFHDVFAQDVPAHTAAIMAATQRPASLATGEEPSVGEAWATIPSWFLIPKQDRVIPPDAQRFMAERAGGEVVEVKGSHAILVSKPGKVADLIEQAAEAVD